MAFTHGVYTQEVPTSLLSPNSSESGLPVIIGTAPIHLSDTSNVNRPVLCYTYADAVKAFGFSKDWQKYTLCEFIYSQFALYGMSPCVLINVLDPSRHCSNATSRAYTITSGQVNLGTEILKDGLIANDGDERNCELNTDYELSYNDAGELIFSVVSTGALANLASVTISCKKVTPESVASTDIIGGVDATTGKRTGLELISRVYPKFRLIPGLIGAPGFSHLSEVAAAMVNKAQNINGLFNAMAVVDIPSSITNYTLVSTWKESHSYTNDRMIACWPKIKLGNDTYHLSTQVIGLINSIDAANDDVPYISPSNHGLQMDSCVADNDTEIELGIDEANELNRNGIITALNWSGGWRAWGNRTAIYPSSTDVKDCFIPVKRMFNWLRNDFITMFWQETDAPMNRRLIRTIVNSYNYRLNGLAAREMILGGRIEFLDSENPTTDLLDGVLRFHIYVTPPTPAETIEGIFEFDTEYLNTLFNTD